MYKEQWWVVDVCRKCGKKTNVHITIMTCHPCNEGHTTK